MAAGTRTIQIAFDGTAKGLNKATSQGTKALGGFRGAIKKAAIGLAGLFAIKKTFQFFGDAIKDAEAFSTAQAITNKVIEQTQGVANVTGKHIDKLTSSMARQTGISDTLVREGANVLLTFKNIRNAAGEGNKVFDRSAALTADMASVFGGDLTSNAKILGKALNDPVAGVSALTRVGVTFTQQQKDQIKALQESGDTLGAQKLILEEIEGQVGGTAAASANATDKIKVVWEQVRRAIGNLLLPVLDKLAVFFDQKVAPMAAKVAPLAAELRERVAPAVTAVAGFVQGTLVPALVNLGKWVVANKDFFVPFVALLAAALAGFKAFMFIKTVIAAVAAFNAVLAANPIGLVIVVLAALVAGLITAYKRSETFRRIVNAAFGAVKAAASALASGVSWALNAVGSAVSGAATFVGRQKDRIVGFFRSIPGAIRSAFAGLGRAISGPFRSAFAAIRRWWNNTLGGKGFSIPSWVPKVGGNEWRFPRLHSGGVFRAPFGQSEGFALLRDGERVVTPEQDRGRGGITVEHLEIKAFSDRFSLRQVTDELAMHGAA